MRGTPERRVLAWAAGQVGWPPDDVDVERLTGGYSWQTYRLGWKRQRVVLRVAPEGGTMAPYDAAREVARVAAAPASVPTPTVLAVDADGSITGQACLLLQNLTGDRILPRAELSEPARDACRQAFGSTLARIHRDGDGGALSAVATVTDALDAGIEEATDHYRRAASVRHPGFEIGLRWMRTHLPRSDAPPVLCHGDFRLANLLWSEPGTLTGVLDWERAWTGDPMADVAFTRIFSGWCSIEGLGQTVYEAAMGEPLDPERLAYAQRFERWRSFTSAMRAGRAIEDGLTDDPRLERIGLAGDAGAWSLVGLLDSGPLVPLENGDWPVGPLRADDLPEELIEEVLDEIAEVGAEVPGLPAAAQVPDPHDALAEVHRVLCERAAVDGPEVAPALTSLGRIARVRLRRKEEDGWR